MIFSSAHNMHFRTYNHETGSNNGGTSRCAILEEIDEELAALLDDEPPKGVKKEKINTGGSLSTFSST